VQPKDHKVKGNANHILIPYEKHYKDPDCEETFKLLDEFEMRNMGSGYTCFVKAFALFISDQEIKIAKSPIIKLFEGINSIEQFEALKLPIKNKTQASDGTNSFAYEIDLSKTDELCKALKCRKDLDCLPVLWVFSTPSFVTWRVKF